MVWRAYVAGDDVDLMILRELFPPNSVPPSDPAFSQDENGTYFTSARLDVFTAMAGDEHREVEWLVTLVNGAAVAENASFRPVRAAGRYTDDEGRTSAVVGAGCAEIRVYISTAGVVGGENGVATPPPPPSTPRFVALAAATNGPAADLLELLGVDRPLTWADLYKVYEIITGETGGADAVTSAGWATGPELSTFRASANRRDISGPEARHARNKGPAPAKVMTLEQGRELMRRLSRAWLPTSV
jgi:hypothetical protein